MKIKPMVISLLVCPYILATSVYASNWNMSEDINIITEDLPMPETPPINKALPVSGTPPSSEVGAKSWSNSDGTWYYTLNSGKATIVAYVGNRTELSVPTIVNGYTVTEISYSKRDETTDPNGMGADSTMGILYGNTTVTKLTIPSSVKLGREALQHSYTLQEVIVQSNPTRLDYGVFGDCSSLTKVTGLSKVTYIDSVAFACCRKISSLDLVSEKVTTWGNISMYYVSSESSNPLSYNITGRTENGAFSDAKIDTLTINSTSLNSFTKPQDESAFRYSTIKTVNILSNISKEYFYMAKVENVNLNGPTSLNIQNSFNQMWRLTSVTQNGATSLNITDSFNNSKRYTLKNLNGTLTSIRSFNSQLRNVDFRAVQRVNVTNSFYNAELKNMNSEWVNWIHDAPTSSTPKFFMTNLHKEGYPQANKGTHLEIKKSNLVLPGSNTILDIEPHKDFLNVKDNRIVFGQPGSKLRNLMTGTYTVPVGVTINKQTLYNWVIANVQPKLHDYTFPPVDKFTYTVDKVPNAEISGEFITKVIDFKISNTEYYIDLQPADTEEVIYGDLVTTQYRVTCNDQQETTVNVNILVNDEVFSSNIPVELNTYRTFNYRVGENKSHIYPSNNLKLKIDVAGNSS